MPNAIDIARDVIAAFAVPGNEQAWWDLYDRFAPSRQIVALAPGRSPSGKPYVQVSSSTGVILFRCILHGSVLPALRQPHKYMPTMRQYFVTPATVRNVVAYWSAAIDRFLQVHGREPRYAQAAIMNSQDPMRLRTVAATLPWTEQGSRPAINWNAVGLSYFSAAPRWTWLARGASKYGYCFTAAGCAYANRVAGESAYLQTILGSKTYSAYLDETQATAAACARSLTTWKRGGNVSSDMALYDAARSVLAAAGGSHG